MYEPHLSPDGSSTGLNPKLVGLLCYLGIFVTGILFLALEKRSLFVRFHAMQSILLSAALFIINIILGFIPIIGWILSAILSPVSFILWIALMLFALQGKWFKLPIIGDIAQQQAAKF